VGILSFPSLCQRDGRPYLHHNNGNGTFTDISEKAGLGAKAFENHWSTRAAWYDRLDLFILKLRQ
jgi:hypothetical protein